ncbi:hypothetical protein NBRC116583_36030 [Arenicella sp. 4NH20-0111]|uniref:winged helix-turn-helix domain-containing tetratricopeptide repeat protein n=1 Tax=Arenicella sp. 4NH20-0111 TaxID=3127648 RepID=UPI00310A6263
MGNKLDTQSQSLTSTLKVGSVSVDLNRNLLTGSDKEVRLEPRVVEILAQLMDASGQVVLRESMLDEHGSDEGITRAISILRKSFKQVGEDIKYIETIPKKGYRLIAPVSGDTKQRDGATSTESSKDIISIAVLAFVDMSENQDQGYLSDGVSEEIINALVQLPFLRVSGRTSSFSFRGENTKVQEIAKALNVSYVLEGSVRKYGDRLRITAQLIEASEDDHVWSENFDAGLNDIFELQEVIACAVEKKLRTLFSVEPSRAEEGARLTESITKNKEAYEHFLRGRHLMYELSGQRTIPRAVAAFEKAIEEDPAFTKAWANLAIANFTLPEYSTTSHWRDHIEKAKEQAMHALQLDPNVAWAQRAKAGILSYELQLDLAVEAYEKAYELEPNNPELMFVRGYILAAIGLHAQADELMRNALDREPLIGSWYAAFGTVQFSMGRLDQAESLFRQSFECNFGYGAILYSQLLSHLGREDEAIEFMTDNFDELGAVTRAQLKSPFVRKLTYSAFFRNSRTARVIMDGILTKRMNDPKYQPALGTIIGFIMIGRPEKFFQHVLTKPNPYVGFSLSRIWEPTKEAIGVRTHKDFPKFAESIGLVRAWQKYGWPETVQPFKGTDGSNHQFECK